MTLKLLVSPRDPLIFRDGKPFDVGVHTASSLDFPLPSTLAGMCRTALGLAQAPDFFDRRHSEHEQRIALMLQIALQRMALVGTDAVSEPFFPAPADAIGQIPADEPKRMRLTPLCFRALREDEATDWQRSDWLYPFSDAEVKPDPPPKYWGWSTFREWLTQNRPIEQEKPKIGIDGLTIERYTHVAIDPSTATADPGRLFQVRQLRFESSVESNDAERVQPLGIAIELSGVPAGWSMPSFGTLGGDRRVAALESLDASVFPECPEAIGGDETMLRLVLITPGLFEGGWCPGWLNQTVNDGWVNLPGTDLEVCLRSAVVPRWQPVSGWNLKKKGDRHLGEPRHFRKAVAAGSVYLIETRPETSKAVAAHLWGKSICENEQDRRDGFGLCLVGNYNMMI